MTYTVVWVPSAESDLATLWVNSADRQAVAEAADRIDAALRRGAPTCGESRSGRRRVHFDPPLGVDFEFDDQDRTARVLAVWRLDRD
jgi:plasmid stabilization system protein ParE